MNEMRGIINISTYGSVSVHLKEVMEERGITRYRLAKLADTRFEVIDKWCSGGVERIDLDVLARLCYVLNCNISDILKYKV